MQFVPGLTALYRTHLYPLRCKKIVAEQKRYMSFRLKAASGRELTHFLKNRFFVASCGFGLIEQAAYRAANQVDHGDEVGLVPVAASA